MSFYFSDLMELSVVILALYGLFVLLKKGYQKIISIDDEKKQNFFNTAKVILIGGLIGLLFYLTPIMNETVKIVVSLIVTLGSFIATFIIKEKSGYNFVSRALVFLGQVFFGVTMFLLMVNTNLGYSPFFILLIWTIFNFYIYKEFNKSENVALFAITLLGTIITAITTFTNDLEVDVVLIGLAIILLGCEFFNIRKGTIGKIVHNILITIFMIALIGGIDSGDTEILCFVVTLVLLLGTILLMLLSSKEKINVKSFLMYVPFVVALLISGEIEGFGLMISLFTLLVVMWLLSEKSIYKKALSMIVLFQANVVMLDSMQSDALYNLILIASTFLTLIFLLEPKKKVVIEEGVGEDEE